MSEKLVHIEPEKVRGKDIFQAFGAPCKSSSDSRTVTEEIFKNFPDTLSATSVIKVACYEENNSTVFKLDNDGERGAGERIKKMMEKTGMKNCVIVIARHFGQHINQLRWTVIQNQFTRIAEKLGYKVPSMNIHAFFPQYGTRYSMNQSASRYPQINSSARIEPLITWPYRKVQPPHPFPTNPYYPTGSGPLMGNSFPASQGTSQRSWNSYNSWNNHINSY